MGATMLSFLALFIYFKIILGGLMFKEEFMHNLFRMCYILHI